MELKKAKSGESEKARFGTICVGLLVSLLAGCGPIGALTREYYTPPTLEDGKQLATVTGYLDDRTVPSRPVRVFVAAIDGKPVSLPKPARCSFDKGYPVSPGAHSISISLTAGPDYTDSLVTTVDLSVNFEPGTKYVAKGTFRPENVGIIWVENGRTGGAVTSRSESPLKNSPQKGIPVGFAAMANSCSLP